MHPHKLTVNDTSGCKTKLPTPPIRSRTKERCPFSLFLVNIGLEVLASAIRPEKERKGIEIKRKKHYCPYLQICKLCTKKIPQESVRKLVELLSDFIRITGYNKRKSILFLYNMIVETEI